ncbi:MAG: hypothetical protein SLRJCFUN_001766 [Candidatus Fervidibacter sp.]|jgi:hypothetical protein
MLRREGAGIRCYTFWYKDDEEIGGIYFPEQLYIVDENEPNFFGIHYVRPQLSLSPKARYKEILLALKKLLLDLDEQLPDERMELDGFEILPEDIEPPDIWWAPHPEDYARLKAGKRKRITELPEWKIYFGETTSSGAR